MLILRSIIFYLILTAITISHATLSIIIGPFLPFKQRHRFITFWCQMNIWLQKYCCGVNYRIRGLENIPDDNGIVLSNHQSSWETFCLHILFRPQTTVLKQSLVKIPMFGWGLRLLEPIKIDREQKTAALKQIITQGRTKLDEGNWVVIYPEGTRIAPGQESEFSMGGALLAAKTGYPVIPVAHNAGEFSPAKSFIKRPGTIELEIGPAISSEGRSAKQIGLLSEQWIREKMAQLNHGKSSANIAEAAQCRNS